MLTNEKLYRISNKENCLLFLTSHGMTVKDAAATLEIKIRTAEAIINRLKSRFECHNLTHLIATLIRNNVIN